MSNTVLYGKQPAKVNPADGLEGFLCRSIDGSYFFRIYHEDGAFTDYDVRHYDLVITIHDESVFLYELPDGNVLDYGPEALGLEEIETEER